MASCIELNRNPSPLQTKSRHIPHSENKTQDRGQPRGRDKPIAVSHGREIKIQMPHNHPYHPLSNHTSQNMNPAHYA